MERSKITEAFDQIVEQGWFSVLKEEQSQTLDIDLSNFAMKDFNTCLISAGGNFSSVTKVRIFLTDINDRSIINPKRIQYFGEHKPASTLVEVSALVDPRMTVEIEAEAIVC